LTKGGRTAGRGTLEGPATPAPVVAARPGTLAIAVNVPDATVEVGGQTIKAKGGRASVSLPPGDYELVVSAPGRKTSSKSVTVGEAARVDASVHLDRGASAGAKVAAPRPKTPGAPAGDVTKEPAAPADKPPAKDPTKKPPGDDDTVW
jgi:hypothetical protein